MSTPQDGPIGFQRKAVKVRTGFSGNLEKQFKTLFQKFQNRKPNQNLEALRTESRRVDSCMFAGTVRITS